MDVDVDVVLFDWGGTLARVAHEEALWAEGARDVARLAAQWGRPADGVADALSEIVLAADRASHDDPEHREVRMDKLWNTWAEQVGLAPFDADEITKLTERFTDRWIGSLDPYPSTCSTLSELRRRGYRIGLVSNCWTPLAGCRKELERQGIWPLLDFAIFSVEVGYRKPHPAMYESALREAFPDGQARQPARALFVGDAPIFDVAAPAALGMRTALLVNADSRWPKEQQQRCRPDLAIASAAELLPVLAPRR